MSNASKRISRRIGIVAGFVALAAIPALGLGAFAAADTGSGETTPRWAHGRHPPLSDAQRQCLADQGVTLPERSASGQRPAPPTAEQREAEQLAAAACDIPLPAHGRHPALSDAQRQCLADQGVTLPERSASGQRPAPPTAEQRAADQLAAAACDIPLPTHRHAGPDGTSI